MKHLSLVGGIAVFALGAIQSSLPAVVQTHDQKLREAKALSITYTVQVVGGASQEHQLTFAKPNLFKVTRPDGFSISDGKTIVDYKAADNSYIETPATPEALKALSKRPEVWGWSSFFNIKALEEIASAKVGATRNIKGQPSIEVVETLKEAGAEPVTFYIDQKLGVARSYRFKTSAGELLIMASEIVLSDTSDPAKFAITLPAGAHKVEPTAVPAISYAEVQVILNQNCMPCHSMQNNKAGIQLTNHGGAFEIVTPGNATDSLLVRSLRGNGASKMPKGKPSLPEEKIKLIEAWIAAGAKP